MYLELLASLECGFFTRHFQASSCSSHSFLKPLNKFCEHPPARDDSRALLNASLLGKDSKRVGTPKVARNTLGWRSEERYSHRDSCSPQDNSFYCHELPCHHCFCRIFMELRPHQAELGYMDKQPLLILSSRSWLYLPLRLTSPKCTTLLLSKLSKLSS